tara:strand:+ start:677 stop:877 length:201 start_codon:yes stop_codon:yes gene_type:complete
MEVKYKILLSEKERDLLVDLIEHRIFLIRSRIDESTSASGFVLKATESQYDCKELDMLEKIGDRLV